MQHTCVLHVVLVNALKNIYYYTAGEYNKKRKLQTMFTVYELANFLPLEYNKKRKHHCLLFTNFHTPLNIHHPLEVLI